MRHEVIPEATLIYHRKPVQPDIDALIREHSQRVRRLAWHVHSGMSSEVEIEDLIQVGMIALVEAGRNFEERGIPFAPYANTRIRGAMIDELRRASRQCRSAMADRRKLDATRRKLQQQLLRPPTDAEMSQSLELDAAAYHELAFNALTVQVDPIDDHYSDHDPEFADGKEGADVSMERAELLEILETNIASLPQREALVLNLYFVEELNLHEIGEILQLTPARVCQIKKRGLESLAAMMQDHR
jgi:RNA polymerase sigma factor for flagellar operon FliA